MYDLIIHTNLQKPATLRDSWANPHPEALLNCILRWTCELSTESKISDLHTSEKNVPKTYHSAMSKNGKSVAWPHETSSD